MGKNANSSMTPNNTNFNIEHVGFVFHGFGMTHFDTFSHAMWNDMMYNGKKR